MWEVRDWRKATLLGSEGCSSGLACRSAALSRVDLSYISFSIYSPLANRIRHAAPRHAIPFRLILLVLIVLPLSVYGQQSSNPGIRAVDVQMRNVMYHFTDQI